MDKDLEVYWGTTVEYVLCEYCDWRYLKPQSLLITHCPNCHLEGFKTLVDSDLIMPIDYHPECYLPYKISKPRLRSILEEFAHGVPFRSQDMDIEKILSRIRYVFLPLWLVDTEVNAWWQAELGFDYKVISHEDRYDDKSGGWASRELEEIRVRWESRLGSLDRTYHNVRADAMEDRIDPKIAKFDTSIAKTYSQLVIEETLVCLPNRDPDDAWNSVQPVIQELAANECRNAAGGDHIRQFTWKPEFIKRNWTLMLLPMISSYYLDDSDKPQGILINGQTGQIRGRRIASVKRAQKASLIIIGVALISFLLSLGISALSLMVPLMLPIGVLGLTISLVVGLCTILPVTTVWWYNRRETLIANSLGR